jgi:hypothetical protein
MSLHRHHGRKAVVCCSRAIIETNAMCQLEVKMGGIVIRKSVHRDSLSLIKLKEVSFLKHGFSFPNHASTALDIKSSSFLQV